MPTNHDTEISKYVHHGHTVQRFRELLGIKQETLANELGSEWDQGKISKLEQKAFIEPQLLGKIADALNLPPDILKDYTDIQPVNIIANTFKEGSILNTGNGATFNINHVAKWDSVFDENKKLYERLIKEKDDKIALLKKLLEGTGKK